MTIDEKYIPLNVKTYSEGFLRLQGWIAVVLIAFLTGGLLVLYELVIINVEDGDFRDMLFDYRVTAPGVRYHSRYFTNAQYCCNHDPTIFKFICEDSEAAQASLGQTGEPPYCPPVIEFACSSLKSKACNQTREAVYGALGMDLSGQPEDCSRVGRARLRVTQGSTASPALAVSYRGRGKSDRLALPADPTLIDPDAVSHFVDAVVDKYGDPSYRSPLTPLSRGMKLNGRPLILFTDYNPPAGDTNLFGWPWELWPWPPSVGCPDTGRPQEMYITGAANLAFDAFQFGAIPTVSVAFQNDSITLPQYKVTEVVQSTGTAAAGSGGNDTIVRVSALDSMRLKAGLVAPMDGCNAWWIDKAPPAVSADYTNHIWQGSLGRLRDLTNVTAGVQRLALTVHDVGGPVPLALPAYRGELYIFVAIAMGGIWFFGSCFLIIFIMIIAVNVQRHQGLQPFMQYMRSYRGW